MVRVFSFQNYRNGTCVLAVSLSTDEMRDQLCHLDIVKGSVMSFLYNEVCIMK